MRHVFFMSALALAVVAVGCTSSTVNPAPPPPIVTTFNVPASDTEPGPVSGTAWDVLSVQTSRTGPPGGLTYTNIAITTTFLQTNAFASLPAPGGNIGTSGTLLGIIIGFDADQNSATGTSASCNGFSYGTGFDHVIDGGVVSTNRLADGNFQILVAPALTPSGEATVTGSGNTVTVNVPISALGGTGQTNMFLGIENSTSGNGTDCVPDASTIQT